MFPPLIPVQNILRMPYLSSSRAPNQPVGAIDAVHIQPKTKGQDRTGQDTERAQPNGEVEQSKV